MSYDIKGKSVLITGANRGIGRELVDAFIEEGAGKIYAAVRTLDAALPLSEKHGDKISAVHIDLADPQSITAAAVAAPDVDIVINNAGILKNASPLSPDAIGFLEEEMAINVHGLMRMAQAFAPVLANNHGGIFIQLNSIASLKCFADFATYSASKAAAYSITQGLREKMGEKNTRVISVHPGPIATDMAKNAGLDEMAEPVSVVADAIIHAVKGDEFHVFPDTMAKQFGEAYEGFAKNIVEADLSEA